MTCDVCSVPAKFHVSLAINKTRIGLLGLDCGSDQIGLAIRLKFKVTVQVIACWLLYECKGIG